MLTYGCTVTIHAPLVLEPDGSQPGGLPLLAPATIGAVTDVVNDTPGTRTFGAIHLLGIRRRHRRHRSHRRLRTCAHGEAARSVVLSHGRARSGRGHIEIEVRH